MIRSSRLRIVVLGYIVRGPLGGLAWHHLQYVIGLSRLGHDVYFIEDSDDYEACYDPSSGLMGCDPTYGLRFATRAFQRFGLGERWGYYDAHTSKWFGPLGARSLDIVRDAELLINVSGVNPLRPWFMPIPVRALIDTDPAFTQIRHLTNPSALDVARQHNAFMTFGENVGRPDCSIPDDGLPWMPTRQPIVLDQWPVMPLPLRSPLTTVMQWESYPSREYSGRHYGQKSDSFAPYMDMPLNAGGPFELALGGKTAPKEAFREKGWVLRNPLEVTRDPWTYQQYIQESCGEFSVAKHGYVVSRSGWFSERSAAYLASGRPVITQDTAFSDWLPTGKGIFTFSTPEEAVCGVHTVRGSQQHSKAARDIAATYFDSANVLRELIDTAWIAAT
jgi:hypothetical protein